MAKLHYGVSPASVVLRVKLMDSSVSTGAGLTGLSSASAGLIISTLKINDASATAYTQAGSTIESIATLGTYAAPTATKCRFKEVDATNHPGIYELQFADARFQSTDSLLISISGATNLAQADLEVQCSNLAANMVSIDGQLTNGNNATLNLKQLNIQNSAAEAVLMASTASNKEGLKVTSATGNAVLISGDDNGVRIEASGASSSGILANGVYAGINAYGGDAGILAEGTGAAGTGLKAVGAGSGEGVAAIGGITDGNGINAVGTGSGVGIIANGGVTGNGMQANGGATSGYGISAVGHGSGQYGIQASGDTAGVACFGNGTDSWGTISSGKGAGNGLKTTCNGSGAGTYFEGDGAGAGFKIRGGSTGNGIEASGGFTSGDGINATAPADGCGINAVGAGTEAGLKATGGATGDGILATGGATSGSGIAATAPTSGNGIAGTGKDTGSGMYLIGGDTNGDGITGVGGTGGSGAIFGGLNGMEVAGGAGGSGFSIIAGTDGDGIRAVGNGTGSGVKAIGGNTNGSGMSLLKGTGGHDLTFETPDCTVPVTTAVTNRVTANTDQIAGVAASATQLSKSAATIVSGTVDTTGYAPTTTQFECSDITDAAADFYIGRTVIFTSGALLDQARRIVGYSLSGGRGHFTVETLTSAPANAVTIVIV